MICIFRHQCKDANDVNMEDGLMLISFTWTIKNPVLFLKFNSKRNPSIILLATDTPSLSQKVIAPMRKYKMVL